MMTKIDRGRVIVGVDGSPESIRALREATAQARCRQTELFVVNVVAALRGRLPVLRRLGDGVTLQWRPLRSGREDQSWRMIADCLHEGFGGEPDGVEVHRLTEIGRPGPALTALARRPDDLLVVGHRRDPWYRSVTRRSVSRYCADHAQCSVLVVTTEQSVLSKPSRPASPAPGRAKAA
ncbi:MAG TPA: universal stress protein [Nocardioidaceae bacterium]|nr:universal stress protein [Nocardioidaceae bacterium]